MDINGDGKISADELKETFAAGVIRKGKNQLGDNFIEQLIQEADTNSDGFIDFEEFKTAME